MPRRTWLCCALWMLTGCAPANSGLLIGGVLAPSDSCTYESGNLVLLSGTLDVAPALTDPPQRVTYTIHPLYQSQLINLGQNGTIWAGTPGSDPNSITVHQAEVELRDFNGAPLAIPGLPNPYRVPATGFVPSSDGTTPGEGIGSIEIIPPVYGAALATFAVDSDIVASVQVIGRTAGDAEVVSPALDWRISICSFCLYACQTDADMVELCVPSCTPGQDSVTITPGVCPDAAPITFGNCLASGS